MCVYVFNVFFGFNVIKVCMGHHPVDSTVCGEDNIRAEVLQHMQDVVPLRSWSPSHVEPLRRLLMFSMQAKGSSALSLQVWANVLEARYNVPSERCSLHRTCKLQHVTSHFTWHFHGNRAHI